MPSPPFVTLPAGVRRRDVETSRGSFAALEAAPARAVSRRRTALLVPGYTGSKEDFIAVLRPLAEAGHRAVAIDMRGQYETPGPDDPTAYTVEALGADVAAVLAVLNALGDGPVHLLGHSFGGLVTRSAVLDGPGDGVEGGRKEVASFTLLSSGPAAVDGTRATHARLLAQVLTQYGIEAVWQGMEALNAQDPVASRRSPEVVDFHRSRLFGNTKAGLVGMSEAILTEPDRVDELAAAGIPLLVAYGENDDAWPPEEQAKMAARLGASHVVVPNAGHTPAADAPEETVAALLDFWASAERGDPA